MNIKECPKCKQYTYDFDTRLQMFRCLRYDCWYHLTTQEADNDIPTLEARAERFDKDAKIMLLQKKIEALQKRLDEYFKTDCFGKDLL